MARILNLGLLVTFGLLSFGCSIVFFALLLGIDQPGATVLFGSLSLMSLFVGSMALHYAQDYAA